MGRGLHPLKPYTGWIPANLRRKLEIHHNEDHQNYDDAEEKEEQAED